MKLSGLAAFIYLYAPRGVGVQLALGEAMHYLRRARLQEQKIGDG
jgi:hypothetical protein